MGYLSKGDRITQGEQDIIDVIGALGTPLYYLRINAAGTNVEWAAVAGGGDVTKVGTPVNNQIGVWTGDGTIEGDSDLTFDTATNTLTIVSTGIISFGGDITLTHSADKLTFGGGVLDFNGNNIEQVGQLGLTGERVTKGWFTDLEVTNAIVGSITGNSATVTVAAEASDTTCFITFASNTTGSLPMLSHANMTFNASTGVATFASVVLTTADINGGTLDGVVIGGASAAAATITTLIITSMGGNWTNAGRTIADLGIVTTVDINGGTLDGVAIGASAASTAVITTLSITSFGANWTNAGRTVADMGIVTTIDINGGTIDGTTIGASSATTGVFTTLVAGSTTSILVGTAGSAVGNIGFRNGTSGTITLAPVAGALGTVTLTLPARTDTLVTLGGTETLTAKTLTSPTIGGTALFAEGGAIAYDSASSADGVYTGFVRAGTAGTTLAFGDLVYLASADSRWELADADAASTSDRFLGMCVLAAASDGDPTTILLMGFIRADAAFPAMTIGSAMYVGETAGDIQVAIPTGADNIIRRVGYAWTADELYFNPSMDAQVSVA